MSVRDATRIKRCIASLDRGRYIGQKKAARRLLPRRVWLVYDALPGMLVLVGLKSSGEDTLRQHSSPEAGETSTEIVNDLCCCHSHLLEKMSL